MSTTSSCDELKRVILYHHIPKTGGQSLATRMASAFPINRSSIMGPDMVYPDGVARLQTLLDTNDFIECHINGPVLSKFQELDILVTVREPVSQIVSYYLHITREPASPLHRAAKLLSPQTFFKQFGDLLANNQTRYFINALFDCHHDIERLTTWTSHMLNCLDRARWFVPTESIDEFCMLWQLETRRTMMLAKERINIAPVSRGQRKELESIVVGMPELYSIDLLFWQTARQRYDDYKRRVLSQSIADPYPDNWGRVWSDGPNWIWIGRGWHRPQLIKGEYEFWAGPERLSEIRFRRDATHRYLVFSISVFCGVSASDIIFITADGQVMMPVYRETNDKKEFVFLLDLEKLGRENVIWLRVPEVWSPIMVDQESTDTSRKSVAIINWKLLASAPFDAATHPAAHVSNIKNLHAGDGHGLDIGQRTE